MRKISQTLTVIFLLLAYLGAHAASPTLQSSRKILVLGDSLSAAQGMTIEKGWVNLLNQYLKKNKYPYVAINASISGDTTSAGLSRLPKLLATHQPSIVILELGANDGLRGLRIPTIRKNLAKAIELCQKQSAKVLLIGMRLPPNYGPDYTNQFHALYADLAKQYQLALVPFLLEGVALNPTLMQKDKAHPTAEAQPKLLNNILPHILPLLT